MVAPFVGAWIEILQWSVRAVYTLSLRSSERGLKSKTLLRYAVIMCRSVRRSVD